VPVGSRQHGAAPPRVCRDPSKVTLGRQTVGSFRRILFKGTVQEPIGCPYSNFTLQYGLAAYTAGHVDDQLLQSLCNIDEVSEEPQQHSVGVFGSP